MRTLSVFKAACAAALFLAAPTISMADDDSSADVDGGFVKAVEQSDAVMIRVPINENGDENTDAAQIKVYQGQAVKNVQDAVAAFDSAVDGTDQPTVSEDSSTDADSSTYWGWRHGWHGYGWRGGYYYNSYYPRYYNYGYTYNYGYPSYYNYYGYYPYYNYGYRYYYYPRYW